MSDMEYKISAIKHFSEQTYGKDNNHRVVINFEGQEKDYSAFVKEKPSVGDVWNGEVKKTEKNDKIYWNFEFPRGSKPVSEFAPSMPEIKNAITLKVIPLLEKIYKEQVIISERLDRALGSEPDMSRGFEYPKMDETNDAAPF